MAFNPTEHFIRLPKKKKNERGQWETINTDYLEVKWRVVWFREEKPNWGIETEAAQITNEKAIFKCTIKDESGRIISTGYGSETPNDFQDFIEKAETKSVGRALAYLGYGTQFAPELDEGDRIADSPIERVNTNEKPNTKPDKITEYQKKVIGGLVKSKKLTPEKMSEIIKELYKKDNSNELTKKEASNLIEYIKGL